MKITISGVGLGLSKTGFGLNAFSGAYLQVKPSQKSTPITYGIGDYLSLGSESSTVLAGHVDTKWFPLKPANAALLSNPGKVTGKKAELILSGALIVNGSVDVELTLIDNYGNKNTIFSKADVASSGFQASATSVRGIIKLLPGKSVKPDAA